MFDVFTEEIEVLIKDGIANLYWYKGDLQKAWLRSRVPEHLLKEVSSLRDHDGGTLTKRRQMDALYERLRKADFNRRLEVSRNFVRILVEQNSFSRQDDRHRIEVAERASLKLKELLRHQEKERESRVNRQQPKQTSAEVNYHAALTSLKHEFFEAEKLPPQQRGYALEKIFNRLMQASRIEVYETFKIAGEQFDGAIKHEGRHYLIELKWTLDKTAPIDVNHFYMKVDGKMDARGLLISMSGFTPGVLENLPRGKDIKVMLLDGIHFANVIFGQYKFTELLNFAITQASLKGNIYCASSLQD